MSTARSVLKLVKGQDRYIKDLPLEDGMLSFAVDTKKIYLDCDFSDLHGRTFNDRYSFGGNSGIFYGNRTFSQEEIESSSFVFIYPDNFDGDIDEIPNIDDIIINTDGCFYRILDIDEEDNEILISTSKLTVAGSGGGTGGGSGGITVARDPNQIYNIIAANGSIPIGFKVTDSIENSKIDVEVTINGIFATTFTDITQNEYTSIELYNFLNYFEINSTNTIVLRFINEYDHAARLTIRNIRLISLYVELGTIASNTSADSINLSIKPYGGSAMSINRWINVRVHVPSILNEETYQESYDITIDNGESIPYTYNFIDRITGLYEFEVWISAQAEEGGEILSSPIARTQVYWRDINDSSPALVTNINKTSFNQYNTAILSYFVIYNDGESNISLQIYCDDQLIKTDNMQVINNSQPVTYTIELTKFGVYKFKFSIPEYNIIETIDNIIVNKVAEKIPEINIDDSSLQLYLDAKERNNNEVNPAVWHNKNVNRDIDVIFENFNWKNNGWITDKNGITSLHLTNGARIEIPFAPFSALNSGAEYTGKTIEIIFKINNIRDIYTPFIEMASKNNNGKITCGIIGTGEAISLSTQEIIAYRTPEELQNFTTKKLEDYYTLNGTRAYLAENQRIHIAFSIQDKIDNNRIIYTYINGVISGLLQYSNQDKIIDLGTSSNIIINSDAMDVDIYAIRVYNKFCGDTVLLNNYAADLPNVEDRIKIALNNDAVNTQGAISLKKVQELGNIPYIVFTDLRKTDSKKGKNDDGTIGGHGDLKRLPINKKDYRWAPCYFVDPEDAKHLSNNTDTGYEEGYIPRSFGGPNNLVDAVIYAQGTSTLAYAVKNLRLRFVNKKDYYSLRPAIAFEGLDSNDNTVRAQALEQYQKFENVPKVALFTLKKDFMDSSMAHNTGIGNILTGLYSDINLQTAAQIKYKDTKTIVNNIIGFPCIAFWQTGEGIDSAEYIGRYNFNTDKDSKDDSVLYGFTPNKEDKFGVLLDENNNLKNGFIGTLDSTYDENKSYYTAPIYDDNYLYTGGEIGWDNYINTVGPLYEYVNGPSTIQCWEFLVNTTALNKFQSGYDEEDDPPIQDEKGNIYYLNKWCTAFESRYPVYETEVMSDKRGFKRLINWIHSTDQNLATNELLPEEQYGFTHDTKEYRLNKFIQEFDNYMDKDFTTFYYIITELFLMIDSRGKNMMMCSFDIDADAGTGHWFPIFYDMDTSFGVDNSGVLRYNYNIDDAIEQGVYNASANYGYMNNDEWIINPSYSTLWANFREGFSSYIDEKYNTWKRMSSKLSPDWILKILNEKQAEKFAEIYDNKDAQYSYIRPLTTPVYIEDGDFKGETISNKLFAEQGTRSLHRQQWLTKRFNLLSSKYAAGLNEDIQLDVNSAKTAGNNHPNPEENSIFKPISQSTQYISVRLENNGTLYSTKLEPEIRNSTYHYSSDTNANDSKFYIYNLNDVYDLGDFSNKFCRTISFKTKNKLRNLKLGQGNWIDNDEVKVYSSEKSVDVSGLDQCSLLENLDIQNVSFTNVGNIGEAISTLIYLQTLLAKGSNLKTCILPAGSNIRHLELPAITTLKLQDCISLNNITDASNLIIEDYSQLTGLYIGGCKNVNTYNLIEQIRNANAYIGYIRLTDINWTINPNDNNCHIINNNEDLAIIDDIFVIDYIYNIPNAYKVDEGYEPVIIQATNGEFIHKTNNDYFNGIITINNENYLIDDYALKAKYSSIFPKLQFKYTNNNNVIKGYSINLYNIDDLNTAIPSNNNTNKQNSVVLSSTQAIGYNLANHLVNNSDIPIKTSTQEWWYEFKGWSLTPINANASNDEIEINLTYPMNYNELTESYDIENAPISLTSDDYQNNALNLYAVFKAHKQKYSVNFMYYEEGTENNYIYDTKLIEYNDLISLPEIPPVLINLDPDNDQDKSKTTIQFLNTYQYNNRTYDQFRVSQTMTLYPVYFQAQYMDQLINPPAYYFDTQEPELISVLDGPNSSIFVDNNNNTRNISEGVEAIIKSNVRAEAVCVPQQINNKYVISIRNESKYVKRIYFDARGVKIRYITGNAGFNGSYYSTITGTGSYSLNNDGTYSPDVNGIYKCMYSGFVENGLNTTLEYIDLGALDQLNIIGGVPTDLAGGDSAGLYRVFAYCPNLYIKHLPNSIRMISSYSFMNDESINIDSIPNKILVIGKYAFSGCTNLSNVNFKLDYDNISSNLIQDHNSIYTDLQKQWPLIDVSAFANCSNLCFTYTVNDQIKYDTYLKMIATVGQSAFENCTNFKMAYNQDSNENIDSVLYIGNSAFKGCTSLGLRKFPTNIVHIGTNAFALIGSMAASTIPRSIRYIGKGVFIQDELGQDGVHNLTVRFPNDLDENNKSIVNIEADAFNGLQINSLTFQFDNNNTSEQTEFDEFINNYKNLEPWKTAYTPGDTWAFGAKTLNNGTVVIRTLKNNTYVDV